MDQATPANPDNRMGFNDEIIGLLQRQTAATSAAHLIPYLRPGLRVLDYGCGPGILSVDLAKAVAPGELHGVDMREPQVAVARAVAAFLGQENTEFHVAEVTNLPFEDDFFDVAHGHDILMHVPDTDAALAELKRVLKPGGVIGCREIIIESCFNYPDYGIIGRSWEMFEDVVATDDGHPQIGKYLKRVLHEAGFANIRVSASFDIYSTLDDIDFMYKVANNRFLSRDFTELAISYGASTEELAARMRVAYDEWKDHPGAVCAMAFGQAVASNP